jgi:hypothetical protein
MAMVIIFTIALHTQEKGLEARRLVGNVLCSPLFYSTKTETTSSSISSCSGHVIKPEHAVERSQAALLPDHMGSCHALCAC